MGLFQSALEVLKPLHGSFLGLRTVPGSVVPGLLALLVGLASPALQHVSLVQWFVPPPVPNALYPLPQQSDGLQALEYFLSAPSRLNDLPKVRVLPDVPS